MTAACSRRELELAMRLKIIVLDPELSPRAQRRLIGIVSLVAGLIVAAVAYAAVPNSFSPNQPISSTAMNQNFASLDERLRALESPDLCGQTSKLQPGEIGGYAGARTKCTDACGVPAHMCTAHDLVMVTSTGRQVTTSGWYASGVRIDAVREVNHTVNDCQGFRFTDGGQEGPYWFSGSGGDAGAQTNRCDAREPVLCCRG